jgi:hypothetical protein
MLMDTGSYFKPRSLVTGRIHGLSQMRGGCRFSHEYGAHFLGLTVTRCITCSCHDVLCVTRTIKRIRLSEGETVLRCPALRVHRFPALEISVSTVCHYSISMLAFHIVNMIA